MRKNTVVAANKVSNQQRKQANKKLQVVSEELTKLQQAMMKVLFFAAYHVLF
jgi:hypothetical protein